MAGVMQSIPEARHHGARYAADIAFTDEVFNLRVRKKVMGMWCMLSHVVQARGRADWKLVFSDPAANASLQKYLASHNQA